MDPLPLLLVLLLAAPACPVRDAAEQSLSRLGFAAWPALEWGTTHADMELRQRAVRRVVCCRLAWLDWHCEQRGPLPWADALPRAWPGRHDAIAWHMEHAPHPVVGQPCRDPEPFGRWRTATRGLLRDLAGSLTCEEMAGLLSQMDLRCRHWSAAEGRYTDP